MGSGGGSRTSSSGPPAWAIPYILQGLQQAQNTYFPGGQLLPAAAAVAPLSPDTLAGMNMVEQLSGVQPGSYNSINPQAGPASNKYQPAKGSA